MSRNDTGFLVITGGVTSQLKNFRCQVLKNSCKVDWSTGTNLGGVVTLFQKSVNTTGWELKTSFG
ncbi:expressed protein [Phakopsora pachyrhizi]|uniref:Expressed protein n=1 Tax=Phakopsora pachyrhizi TaxID=170000 RepID=A0AAV0B336_PHAPC|nr:expressed protein [Phakopsora pachyrhizi]CAH7682289.1 expressed protein [Phakopsora pachyrhizi]CAH7682397.1 expressed protein [Phakopsora pachyrhizi]